MRKLLAAILALIMLCPAAVHAGDDELIDRYFELYSAVISQATGPEYPYDLPENVLPLFHVLILDMEILNGGIAQYFWNEGIDQAPFVADALRMTGFPDVAALYEGFLTGHGITYDEIAGYRTEFPNSTGLYHKHDFDAFDDAYMRIRSETHLVRRLLDYAAGHPEVYGE